MALLGRNRHSSRPMSRPMRRLVATAAAAALVVGAAAGAAPAAPSTDRDALVAAAKQLARTITHRGGALQVQATPEFLVADGWEDPADDALNVPNLIDAAMLVHGDDLATPEDEQALLAFVATTSGPTVETDRVGVSLDVDGDLVDDVIMDSPDATSLVLDEPAFTEISARMEDGSYVGTGMEVVWLRSADSYLALLDWKELGLTQARFVFYLDDATDEADHYDYAPDDYTGELITLPHQPSAPRAVIAEVGNASAVVAWSAPANPGTLGVRGYKVTASPGGAFCTSVTTRCAVLGLTNGVAYTFQVQARSNAGDSVLSAPSNAVTPRRTPGVLVSAVDGATRLYVNVNPNKGAGYWSFRVQRWVNGAWRTNVTIYRTSGDTETRTLDLRRGTYRVVVLAKYGFEKAYSRSVYLRG